MKSSSAELDAKAASFLLIFPFDFLCFALQSVDGLRDLARQTFQIVVDRVVNDARYYGQLGKIRRLDQLWTIYRKGSGHLGCPARSVP